VEQRGARGIEKIFADFSSRYPGIKLTSVEVRPDDLVQKLVTESAPDTRGGADTISITMDKAGPLARTTI